jgi:uncharacterized protein with FMN-binding domain
MRRIVVAAMSTLAALVLLFSYHTSLGGGSTPVAAAVPVATGPAEPGPTPSPTTQPSTGSDDSSDDSTASPSPSASSTPSTSTAPSSAAKTYTGDAVDTRWGVVQVQITVANGKITKSDAVQYPQNNGRDVEINSYAVPQLNSEAVAAGNASIDAVSGATVTSDGYIQSLQSAVDQAHL